MSTNKSKKQWFWVILVVAVGLVLSALLFFTGKNKTSSDAATADSHGEGEAGHAEGEAGHAEESEEGSLNLSPKQMTEYGVKLAQVGVGEVGQQFAYPAKLVTNTDQQAHVSATFAGRVESVNAVLGQQVKKGQVLATLFIPDLVDQQANLSIAQEALTLAQQDYQREKQLWEQGVSARQDYPT